MKFPLMNRCREGMFEVSKLDGGLNRRDVASAVEINQLTECKNMWHKDRVLKTRPSVFSSADLVKEVEGDPNSPECDVKMFRDVRYVDDGENYFLFGIKRENADGETRIELYWQGDLRVRPIKPLCVSGTDITYFVILHRLSLYCYLSNQKIYRLDTSDSSGEWRKMTDDDIYIPLVATDLTYFHDFTFISEHIIERGTRVEGINCIGRKIRLLYSTVNMSFFEEKPDFYEHTMLYRIPYIGSAVDLIPTHFQLTVDYISGARAVHRVVATENKNKFVEPKINMNDDYRIELFCSEDSAYVVFYDENDNYVSVGTSDYVQNNMEVIVPINYARRDTVFSMQRAAWFGGASSGIGGGTRLFLGDSSNEKEKNLVLWSGTNEPLYFPAYSYFYVGDSMGAVTGFGKQSDMLVIFKENETYFTQYKSISGLRADENLNGASEFQTTEYYFPLALINSNIGCTLPDTVELCRNKLVWANKDGRIFTLMSNDQYSERNIFEVGGMVSRDLRKENLTDASSGDWEGHYVLKTQGGIYLMDYNSEGFENADSYIKNEDANIRIPWYYWQIGEDDYLLGMRMTVVDRSLVFFGIRGDKNNIISSYILNDGQGADRDILPELTENGIEFKVRPISSAFATSFFDFGAPSQRKNIDRICLSLGFNDARPMLVSFISDCGESCEEVTIESGENALHSAEYLHSVVLCPDVQSVLRLGVKISCEGRLAIDSMSFYYRKLGFAR